METTGGQIDAITLLSSQHREVEHLWGELKTAQGTGDERSQELANRIIELLSRHDAIETMLLYPALRQAGADGDAMADAALEEHQEIRELLKQADRTDIREEAAASALAAAIGTVADHVRDEEGRMFPALQSLGRERLQELGEQMEAAWTTAPTHPHPSTPNNPLAAGIVGTVAGAVDRVRDKLTGEGS